MDLGSAEAVDESRLHAAWRQFRSAGGGEGDVIGDQAMQGGEHPLAAVGEAMQDWIS